MPQLPFNEYYPNYFEEMATIYSEGNEELKKLLLYCFKANVITTACCSGHWEKNIRYPYLAFQYNEDNIKYFAILLKEIVDYGYIVRYGKLNNDKSWFSVTSKNNMPASASLFFNRIYQIISTIERYCCQMIPVDLQHYTDFIGLVEKDEDIIKKRYLDFFITSLSKSRQGYEYIINTSNKQYQSLASNSGFIVDQDNASLYRAENINRAELIPKLKLLSGYIKQKETPQSTGFQYCRHRFNNVPN